MVSPFSRRLIGLPVIGLLMLASAGTGYVLHNFMPATSGQRPEKPEEPAVSARLLVRRAAPSVLTESKMDREEYDVYRQTQVELIRSRWVLSAALRNPQVAECATIKAQADPVAWLEQNLRIEYLGNSEILQIGLSGGPGADLATIVNGIKDAYLREVVDVERRKKTERLRHLQTLFVEYEQEMLTRERASKQRVPPPPNAISHEIEGLKTEVLKEMLRRLFRDVEILKIDLDAPPRIQEIDKAVARFR